MTFIQDYELRRLAEQVLTENKKVEALSQSIVNTTHFHEETKTEMRS